MCRSNREISRPEPGPKQLKGLFTPDGAELPVIIIVLHFDQAQTVCCKLVVLHLVPGGGHDGLPDKGFPMYSLLPAEFVARWPGKQ